MVCEEIESYEDSPAELIYDEFENILFEGHPLGHNILGTTDQVRSYTSVDAMRFTRRYYRPENCVFFVSGDIDFRQLQKALERQVVTEGQLETEKQTRRLAKPERHVSSENLIIRHRDTHQTHVMLGTMAYPADDSRRWALYLLNNILGGPGLNSRLNLALRERNGLVYSVESTMVCYSDTGMWSVYFGCDPKDVERCRRLVRRELDRLMEHPLSPAQLQSAKRQLQGQLAIASDSREQFALDFAKNYLHTGKMRNLTDIMTYIDRLTADELQMVARDLFHEDRITTLMFL